MRENPLDKPYLTNLEVRDRLSVNAYGKTERMPSDDMINLLIIIIKIFIFCPL